MKSVITETNTSGSRNEVCVIIAANNTISENKASGEKDQACAEVEPVT